MPSVTFRTATTLDGVSYTAGQALVTDALTARQLVVSSLAYFTHRDDPEPATLNIPSRITGLEGRVTTLESGPSAPSAGPSSPQVPAKPAGFSFHQTTPAAQWTVQHNLGRSIDPTLLLDADPHRSVTSDYVHPTPNLTLVVLPEPASGWAHF